MNDVNLSDLVAPPSWSLTVGVIGRILIILASGLFAATGVSWLFAPRFKALEKVARWAFGLACGSLLGAFAALGVLFANNRFEYEYVYGHADKSNALGYRIAGIWSGQEGSFLLWATCSAAFALLTVGKTGIYRRWYTIATSFFLGAVASILAFESPFNLNLIDGKPFVPMDGLGLAPSLQNYWVIIHPPTIFLGFGSLTSLFALGFAAMAIRNYVDWLPIVRPWAIVSTTLVGLGLCMGGFWAYETLGWGGFWMWDPVENVSFVPWLFTAAFVHSIIVQTTRKKWQGTNLILSGLPFIVFVYGTFLTRSGFLSDSSVHSFAEMNRYALKLLITLMTVSTLGFLGLWAFRMFQARKDGKIDEGPAGIKKDAFYMVGITLLLTMGTATAIGMSVPLVQALKGEKSRVVEEGVYHQVLPWVFIPMMFLMAITPFVTWRGLKVSELLSKLYTVLCVTIGITGLLVFLAVVTPYGRNIDLAPKITLIGRHDIGGLPWLAFLVAVCTFVLVANVWAAADIVKRSKMGVSSFLSHIGVALLMGGLIISRGFEKKADTVVMNGHPSRVLNYEVRYAGMTSDVHDRNNKIKLEFFDTTKKGTKPVFTATPGLYELTMADGQVTNMVWPHIERHLLMDTYVSLGQPRTQGTEDISVQEGKSIDLGEMVLTYQEMTRKGEFGQAGTRFGALVKVSTPDGKSTTVNPEMELGGEGGMVMHPVQLNDQMELMMTGMNAADKSVNLKVQMKTPIYPVEVYHKPMTILVWLGTGVSALAGFLAAVYRKSSRKGSSEAPLKEHTPEPSPELATALQGKKK
ncbi:MAG: cytochrome c biogenesis protein CcsA [Armatimonadetes bacterium]|nr:cytochrome c biogenesis protein CcsA [Armatimonadota bacterium]